MGHICPPGNSLPMPAWDQYNSLPNTENGYSKCASSVFSHRFHIVDNLFLWLVEKYELTSLYEDIHLPFKKHIVTSGPCGQGTSKVLISRCLWQEQWETSAKLAGRAVPYDCSHVDVKGFYWPQTPNIIFALYSSSLATRNNVRHVCLPLLIGPTGPSIFK